MKRFISLTLLILIQQYPGCCAEALAQEEVIAVDVPAGRAPKMLRNLALQAELEIIYPSNLLKGVTLVPIKGEFTVAEALDRILAGTGLTSYRDETSGALILGRVKTPADAIHGEGDNEPIPNYKQNQTMDTYRKPMKIGSILSGLLSLALANTHTVVGQDDNPEDVYELTPFEVDASQDTGYRATNTLAGSRLNTSLRDTAASVSVWTQEFVEDTGLNDIEELMAYSVGSEIDWDEDESGAGMNTVVNVQKSTSQRVRTRGIQSTKALDYFVALGPDDSYRVGRYDESRGPNGILFGVSNAGGLTNQTSIAANTQRDSGKISLSFGSNDRNRATINLNRVLIEDKLAIALAGVNQENGGWRTYDFNDKERIYGAVTYKANDRLTLRANYESGVDTRAVVKPITSNDQALAWWDNGAATLEPANRNSTADEKAVGIANRWGNDNGNNRRFVYIEDDGGTFFDGVGTFLTHSYNNTAAIAPDGTPGGGGTHLINDTSFMPYEVNAAGSASWRETKFYNYSVFADFRVTDNFFVNVSHNYQEVDIDIPYVNGVNPTLRGDPNTLLGNDDGDVANPYAGSLYYEAQYLRDSRLSTQEETRLSLSYDLNSDGWMGEHRFGAMVSQTDLFDRRVNRELVLGGDPFGTNGDFTHGNNVVRVRKYVEDVNDPYSFRLGDWREVPETLTVDGVEYPVVWGNMERLTSTGVSNVRQNLAADTVTDTRLAVVQSHFLNRKLVTTIGYREDDARNSVYGHYVDPLYGLTPDLSLPDQTVLEYSGSTRTAGVVYHVSDNFYLVANESSNIGIPEFNRNMLPDGEPPVPADGEGVDYGIGFDLFDRKVTGRLVYYEAAEYGISNGGNHRAYNDRIGVAVGDYLVNDAAAFASQEDWESFLAGQNLNPFWNGRYQDTVAEGYELTLTANPTQNWSLILNASETDRTTAGFFEGEVDYFGFLRGDDGLLVQGVNLVDGEYVVDPDAFTSDGAVARWLDVESTYLTGDENFTTITTTADGGERSVAQEVFELIDVINDAKIANEKRWGLRPYKVKLWTKYDFNEGPMKGFTVGGGYRWTSPNVMDEDDEGNEIEGEAIIATDLMARYTLANGIGNLDGKLSFQLNISNVFDKTDIVPQRYSVDGDYLYPGGDRGIAYRRYDLVPPREFRFTTTYSF